MLVVAKVFKLVQGQSGLQQGVPTSKARTRVDQFGLPMVELAAQFAAQVEVGVHHLADDAQHHVGWAQRNAPCTRRSWVVGRGFVARRVQKAAGVGFAHDAVVGVHAQQHSLKHRKTHWAGVDALQDGWAWPFDLDVCGLGFAVTRGSARMLRQSAKHQQVVVRGEVVA